MRAVQDGRLGVDDAPVRAIDLCLGCRACEAVCPSGVQYGNLLEHTRDHIERHYRRGFVQTFLRRVAIEKVFPFPSRMKLALLPARFTRRMGAEKFLPKFARDAMSLIPAKPSALKVQQFSPAIGAKKGRVGFVSGCVMPVMFGDTNAASVNLLNRAGYDVVTPPSQGCCGALYAHSGQLDMARETARKNIEAFEKENVDAIIINAAGCGSTLKEYGELLAGDAQWEERGRKFSSKVKDLTEWLAAKADSGGYRAVDCKVTYHDACHLAHAQRVTKPPRELVKAVAGSNYVELSESDVCCGSAGTYNLTEPAMAERLQNRKIQNILATGAKIVVTTNPGCLLQVQAGLRKADAKDVEAMHIADFLVRFMQ